MAVVEIIGSDKTVEISSNMTLLDAIRRAEDIRFETPCNGHGTCGKCKVIAWAGQLTPFTSSEEKALTAVEKAEGFRLACCASPAEGFDGRIVIELPRKEEKAVVLADADYKREVGEPLFLENGGSGYGIAVDIGTTTVAAVLLDLTNGETLARTSAINPQTEVGGDVLSRIAYTISNPGTGLKKCQELIVKTLNEMTGELLSRADVAASDLKGYAVAANCTMLHLLLGVDPESLSRAPFTPVFTGGRFLKASEIGLCPMNPQARLYCLPSVSAYIGADIVAGIYMSGIDKTDKNVMFIDIGTNGEIVLSKAGNLYACSCAAGPAMEGMNISNGMRAAEGAIEGARYNETVGMIWVRVIGDTRDENDILVKRLPPTGICGSGVLECVAVLLKTHAINSKGKVTPKGSSIEKEYYQNNKEKGYRIWNNDEYGIPSIYFSQADVRQIQLAKGAILSGFTALVEKSGLTFDDLDEIIIAGQFGKHLKAETLADIGILPGGTRDRVRYIGNSSLGGAISVFLDRKLVDVYEGISRDVDYMELGTYKGYADLFMECLTFPAV